MDSLTFFLFPKPTFSEGVGRLIDVGGHLNDFNRSDSGLQADRRALASDWCQVGSDLRHAIESETAKASMCPESPNADAAAR